ncbi:HD-GYP domain-containing protein [Geosporobacter ferrireducens]|uniref:HD-GYP domain-containing protein n=1 Tax=Geosporobacter ferrireducens TaxID=1424294 RepID=A0A1D8GFQ1_9FIRM|nr:HD domain-containing phosphohydrolase [Geosporobacter ferrireducens]AOT69734.1 hypothetical protein Gferi_09145 [Geosporobacter ferrireducens]MTI54557.1 HD domain-containing protein [Geosporobacter ferrireducens]
MKRMAVTNLKDGMRIAREIASPTGILLIAAGTEVNQFTINRLRNLEIEYVYIHEEIDATAAIDYNKLKIRYGNLVQKLKYTFRTLRFGQKYIADELDLNIDQLIEELVKSNNLMACLKVIDKKDEGLFFHSANVAVTSVLIAKWLNLSDEEIKRIAYGALFHDIGMTKIGDYLIEKTYHSGYRLDRDEEMKIKKHSVYGYQLLSEVYGLSKDVALIALQHHEAMDGSGYPLKIKVGNIHPFSRIVAIADLYDNLISGRNGKLYGYFEALEYILDARFQKIDHGLALLFVKNMVNFYIGNRVSLSNGKVGEVIFIHNNHLTRPVIRTKDSFVDLTENKNIQILDVVML